MRERTYHHLGLAGVIITLGWLTATVVTAQSDARTAPKAESKAKVKGEGKADPTDGSKSATKKAEAKSAVKADPKATSQPEAKPDAKATAERDAKAEAEAAPIREADEKLVEAFNAGKADELAGMFLPQGELIDEHGTLYQGRQEIEGLLTKFFTKFPESKLTVQVESIRVIGPVAIEEGTRHTASKGDGEQAHVRYTIVRTKVGENWMIASLRDYNDESVPAPHDRLQPLAWLVGDWVNESTDAAVKISYRWSEDKNFLLGDFDITRGGEVVMKSTQRIGWDPLAGKIRSWMFDSDGGYADGNWTLVEEAWVIKSVAVMPDGQTGSATVTMTPVDKNRFTMKGTERIVGEERDADFEVTVIKPPPSLSK